MNIGLSTANYFPEYNTEAMIDLYGSLGVDSVEVFLNTYSEMEDDFIAMVKEKCDANGITVNSVHVMSAMMEPCLFDLLDRRRRDFIQIYKQTLKCIRGLGSDIYTFHGVPKNMAQPNHYDHVAACYDVLYELAGEANVRLAQENVAYLASGSIDFIQEMKSRMKHRMVHTLDIKQAVRAGIDPFKYLEVIQDDVVNIHINDHDRDHTCLLPGQGTFDFNRFFAKLNQIDYGGNGILELYRHNFSDEADLVNARLALLRQLEEHGL